MNCNGVRAQHWCPVGPVLLRLLVVLLVVLLVLVPNLES